LLAFWKVTSRKQPRKFVSSYVSPKTYLFSLPAGTIQRALSFSWIIQSMHFLPARQLKKSLHLLFGILTSCTFFLRSVNDDRHCESSGISITGDICTLLVISLEKTFVNRLVLLKYCCSVSSRKRARVLRIIHTRSRLRCLIFISHSPLCLRKINKLTRILSLSFIDLRNEIYLRINRRNRRINE